MKFLHLSLIALALSLAACGDGTSGDTPAEDPVSDLPPMLQNATTMLDMSEHNMPFSLYVPDSTKGFPSVEPTSYGETRVQVGTIFNVVIAEGGDLAGFKQTLEEDLLYQHTIIEQGDDFLLYKSEIKDSFLDPEFHFYAVKTVDGLTFEIHDYNDEGGYAESVARYMLTSINHIMPNNNPS